MASAWAWSEPGGGGGAAPLLPILPRAPQDGGHGDGAHDDEGQGEQPVITKPISSPMETSASRARPGTLIFPWKSRSGKSFTPGSNGSFSAAKDMSTLRTPYSG